MQLYRFASSFAVMLATAGLTIACTNTDPPAGETGGEGGSPVVTPEDLEPEHEGAAPFALVEIFTSEG